MKSPPIRLTKPSKIPTDCSITPRQILPIGACSTNTFFRYQLAYGIKLDLFQPSFDLVPFLSSFTKPVPYTGSLPKNGNCLPRSIGNLYCLNLLSHPASTYRRKAWLPVFTRFNFLHRLVFQGCYKFLNLSTRNRRLGSQTKHLPNFRSRNLRTDQLCFQMPPHTIHTTVISDTIMNRVWVLL